MRYRACGMDGVCRNGACQTAAHATSASCQPGTVWFGRKSRQFEAGKRLMGPLGALCGPIDPSWAVQQPSFLSNPFHPSFSFQRQPLSLPPLALPPPSTASLPPSPNPPVPCSMYRQNSSRVPRAA
eukprot:357267-Chlamydomonas_euryale.AAC.2